MINKLARDLVNHNVTDLFIAQLKENIMFSFLKLFFRNSLRNKAFTFLNILGLAIGMACFIIIMLWVKAELSYDKYNLAC